MNVVQERFVELFITAQYRALNKLEVKEFLESYQYLENRYWKLSKLKALSFLAYQTKDWDWLHEICAEIEKIQG